MNINCYDTFFMLVTYIMCLYYMVRKTFQFESLNTTNNHVSMEKLTYQFVFPITAFMLK